MGPGGVRGGERRGQSAGLDEVSWLSSMHLTRGQQGLPICFSPYLELAVPFG